MEKRRWGSLDAHERAGSCSPSSNVGSVGKAYVLQQKYPLLRSKTMMSLKGRKKQLSNWDFKRFPGPFTPTASAPTGVGTNRWPQAAGDSQGGTKELRNIEGFTAALFHSFTRAGPSPPGAHGW